MDFNGRAKLFLVFFIYLVHAGIAINTIKSSESIKDPETLSSKDGNYTLGFFSPENSTNRYVGIWWKYQSTTVIVWVANRDQPLNDSSGVIAISEDGNLVVLNGQTQVIWSSKVSNVASNTSSQFSDFGKLVLMETATENILWDSFQQPSNSLLPSMKLSTNKGTGKNIKLTSWKSSSNPSIGNFSASLFERSNIPEMFVWNGTRPTWRSGPWNGSVFTGVQGMTSDYLKYGFQVGDDDGQGNAYIFYTLPGPFEFHIYKLNSNGLLEETWWDPEKKEVVVSWTSQETDCDIYGMCGPFAICNSSVSSPICSCLTGFEPRNREEWNRQNWISGCVRRTPLQCEMDKGVFLKLEMVKVPDFSEWSPSEPETCKSQCLDNCSCVAYSHDDRIGCMSWTQDLLDMQQFSSGGLDLFVRVAEKDLGVPPDKPTRTNIKTIIAITVIIGTVVIVICAYVIWRKTFNHPASFVQLNHAKTIENTSNKVIEELSQAKLQDLLLFDLEKLTTATNNFHMSNKLGQGGFGPVYKGKLEDGQEIAVKRLSRTSGQGLKEFMNEVVVISKLQHRNLVKLLGCCIEGNEKMLVYEYMPNRSLDAFVFGPSENKVLDWRKCFNIIDGIARGLLYLHRDSRLRIIHRDLKASNILLDEEINPKISDFGMARIFGRSEDQVNTNRIVGTYGYMSPEYAMQGLFSEKSDVFSFGVLVLEIISGRRNSSFYDDEHALSLLGFAWLQWREDNILSLIDATVYEPGQHNHILRCIHIGLLCVQEHAIQRPTMATVISMLNSEREILPPPCQPAFILRQNMLNLMPSQESTDNIFSVNTSNITHVHGR